MRLGGLNVPPGRLVFLNPRYRYLRIAAAVAKAQLEAKTERDDDLIGSIFWAGFTAIYRPMLDERIHFSAVVPEGFAWIARDDVNLLT